MLLLARLARVACIAVTASLCNGCASARSVIEIPACADRVEITGQAQRLAPIGSEAARFELDHTFDLMFTRTQLSFQGGGGVETFVVESNQPDPLRMFLGIGAVVGGALIAGSAANDVAGGAHPLADRPLALGIAGGALIATGAAAAMTGWRPSRSYVTFPESSCVHAPRDGARVSGGDSQRPSRAPPSDA